MTMTAISVEGLRSMSSEQWEEAWALVLAEAARREVLASARQRAEQAAAEYEAAVAVPDTVPDASDMDPAAVVGPGEHVVVQGVEWVNSSGAWLSPHAAGPDSYPMGWRHADASTLPAAAAWAPGTTYAADDLVTHAGATYRCVQPHTSQAGWEPPAVPALWALA